MVGRRQLLVRNRHCHSRPLGRLALGTALQSWAITRLRHRLGRSSCCRARTSCCPPFGYFRLLCSTFAVCLIFVQGVISRSAPSNLCFLVRSDNAGVVAVTNKGRSRSHETNAVLKHLYQLQAECCMRLQAVYIPSRCNIADALSRGDVSAFKAGFPGASDQVSFPLPPHLVDKLIPWS